MQTRSDITNEETRLAVMSIIVKDNSSALEINNILHEAAPFIIGRMGIPYRERGLSLISIALDAPMDTISAISGKIGNLSGIKVKIIYS